MPPGPVAATTAWTACRDRQPRAAPHKGLWSAGPNPSRHCCRTAWLSPTSLWVPQPRPQPLVPAAPGHQQQSRPTAAVPSRPAALSAPQEFLKKEFSAENVYFWQACERFQQIPASDTQQVPASALPRRCWAWVTQLLGGVWAEVEVTVVPACPRDLADPCSGRLSRLGSLMGGTRRWMRCGSEKGTAHGAGGECCWEDKRPRAES